MRFRCERCGSLLECEINELDLVAMFYCEELYEYLCPVCKQKRQVWSTAMEKYRIEELKRRLSGE